MVTITAVQNVFGIGACKMRHVCMEQCPAQSVHRQHITKTSVCDHAGLYRHTEVTQNRK